MAEGEITTFTALTEKFNLPLGNYKKPKLLYCSNGGHFLRILPDGKVDGTRDRSDQHSKHARRGCSALLLAPVPGAALANFFPGKHPGTRLGAGQAARLTGPYWDHGRAEHPGHD